MAASRAAAGGAGREGGVRVARVQRARLLDAALAVAGEHGFAGMSVASVTRRARVSRRTFYDLFANREECCAELFDLSLARVRGVLVDAFAVERGSWCERVRTALIAVLGLLDEEPDLRGILIVDPLAAGHDVLRRRGEAVKELGVALHRSAIGSTRNGRAVPELAGEAVVAGVLGLVYERLVLAARSSSASLSLLEWTGMLMSTLVLPYEGVAVAKRELERPVPRARRVTAKAGSGARGAPVPAGAAAVAVGRDPLEGLPMRVTYRTLRVLATIAERSERGSDPSNREVGDGAGVRDQGQVSKLLARLEGLGLVENMAVNQAPYSGEANAWRLTTRGIEVERAMRVPNEREQQREHPHERAGASAKSKKSRRRGGE
jgi:AcrR family transcriptional regulator